MSNLEEDLWRMIDDFYRQQNSIVSPVSTKSSKVRPVSTKPSNPKDSVGIAKVPFSTVPSEVTAEVGLAMMEGALKYGRHNYRAVGVRGSVYYDAALRHLTAWWEGQDIDPDSGLSHLVKCLACLYVLRDSQIMGNWVDDRPPRLPSTDWVADLNKHAADLLEKYPESAHTYTQKEIDDVNSS